jgi:hypothetical protein
MKWTIFLGRQSKISGRVTIFCDNISTLGILGKISQVCMYIDENWASLNTENI